jgi:hypothetical protein
MSAQAWGYWKKVPYTVREQVYYPVTKTFGYQEQQIIGVKDAFITYKDTVAIGEQSYLFEYEDLAITGYHEKIGEYSRLKLKDSHPITCLYDWSRRIVGYAQGVVGHLLGPGARLGRT